MKDSSMKNPGDLEYYKRNRLQHQTNSAFVEKCEESSEIISALISDTHKNFVQWKILF